MAYQEQCVRFLKDPEIFDETPYSEVYSCDVRAHVSYGHIENFHVRRIDAGHDPYTGLAPHQLLRLREQLRPDHGRRLQILNQVLLDGSAWERSSAELVAQVSKNTTNKQ